MLSRRSVLAVLGSAGIGTAAFQRALAATAENGPVSLTMIADAEWVAGIELTDPQREAVLNAFKFGQKNLELVRPIELDNSQLPGLQFTPFASSASAPDPRSYSAKATLPLAFDPIAEAVSDDDLAFCSVRQLGKLLRERKISSVELTKLSLQRLRQFDPLLKCVVTFMDDLALKQAERADQELQTGHDRGPLHGIPWGLKDIFSYPGYPTTWGVWQYRDRVIAEKSAVAERLEDAGAVLVAKLATNALAGGSELWYRGITRNPWNPHKGAGGSSSGPAAAVAAGLVGFSIGTETSASIIGPSIRCGVVGLRPTYGRVSRHGCMQLCWSLDKVGPICRNVDDCGLVLAAIHGADPRDAASVDRPFVWPSSRELSTIRVGYVAKDSDVEQPDELRLLSDLGMQLVPVEPPNLKGDFGLPHNEIQAGLVACEAASAFEHLTRRGEPKGVKGWPQWFLLGHFHPAVDYLKLNRLRSIVMQRFDKMMQSVDIFVCDQWTSDDHTDDRWEWYGNFTGHPMVTFPRKFEMTDGFKMPKPHALIGRIYDETTLLTVSHACQRALGLTQRPSLDQFLELKDQFLEGEESLDVNRYYTN